MGWSWDQFMKGAVGGAAGGAGLFGPVGAIAGGALGGMFSGIFGGDEYEERERRKAELARRLAEIRGEIRSRTRERLKEGGQLLSTQSKAMTEAARAAAARRALAAGQRDAEAFIAPETARTATIGSNAMRQFAYQTKADEEAALRQLDFQEVGIERDYADRPIAPGLGDWIGGLGDLAGQYAGLFAGSDLNPPAMQALLPTPSRPSVPNAPTFRRDMDVDWNRTLPPWGWSNFEEPTAAPWFTSNRRK